MRSFILFVLLFLSLGVFGQVDVKKIPFSEWEGKSFPVQDWVAINGDTISKSTFENKVCFINFFAAGCPPCVQEVSYLNSLKKHFSEIKDVIIIGFYSGTKEEYERYVESNKNETNVSSSSQLKLKYSTRPIPKYLIVAIDPSIFRYKYNAWGVPSNLILDKHGIVRYCGNGFPMDRAVQENLYSEYIEEIDKLRH